MPEYLVLHGTLVQCVEYGQVDVQENRVLLVDKTHGTIDRICSTEDLDAVLSAISQTKENVIRLQEHEFIIPGLIDLHVHAPQMDPTKTLVDVLADSGLRAVVGKVCMDRSAPEGYCESTQENLAGAEEVIRYVQSKGQSRLYPCVTPRFIPTCTPDLLTGLAKLAAEHGTFIQSHISESSDEVAFTNSLHPDGGGDSHILDKAGLLTRKAIMAHGTFLTDAELGLLAERGTAIAHCPLSNFFFGDKLFRVNHALSLGVHVGLGTDVAGGYSPSMLNAMRNAVINSRALRAMQFMTPGAPPVPNPHPDVISWKEAFWLATMGGATALGLQDVVGSFQVGKEFDAVLVSGKGGPYDLFPTDSLLDEIEKFFNLGDDRNVRQVFVQGRPLVT